MHIEAVLTRADVTRLIGELTPIRIHMTPTDEDRRWVELDEPERVDLVPGRGVRVVSSGRVRYAVGGLKVPLTIREVQAMLAPRVVSDGDGEVRLAFEIDLEKSDLVMVPDLIDTAIMNQVNDALTPRATNMVWAFSKTLTRSFALPERLEPLDRFELAVRGGEVEVDAEALRFRIQLDASVSRSKPRPDDD